MKPKILLIATMLAAAAFPQSRAYGQTQGPASADSNVQKPVPGKERLSPEEAARRMTDEMDSLLGLSKRQYRKLYRLNLKEQKEKEAYFPHPQGMPGNTPPDGAFRHGGPGHGGQHQFGFPPGQMPGGAGGRPPQEFGGSQAGMGSPPSAMEFEKRLAARERKLKKILDERQYQKWRKAHPDPSGVFDDGIWKQEQFL